MQKQVSTIIGAFTIAAVVWGIFSVGLYAVRSFEGDDELMLQSQILDWKTYENRQGGFSLQYPPDWKVEEYNNDPSGTKYIILSGSQGRIDIDYVNGKYTECSNGQMVTMNLGGQQFDVCHYFIENISESWGFQAKKHGNASIGLSVGVNAPYDSNRDVILNILSTFRFIEVEKIATDWKTYQDSSFGFSLDYPSDMEVAENYIADNPIIVFTKNYASARQDSIRVCPQDCGYGPDTKKWIAGAKPKTINGMPAMVYIENSSDPMGQSSSTAFLYFVKTPGQKFTALDTSNPEKGGWLEISLWGDDGSKINQIISSFRFIK